MDCPLCGGTLEEHPIPDEQVETLRERHPNVDTDAFHAYACTECGHVTYRRS